MNDHEEALIEGLRRQDPQAFEELVRQTAPRLLATITRILGPQADAEEALQETFISAWKSIEGFDRRASLATWLHRIAVNAALGRLRTAQRHPTTSLSSEEQQIGLPFDGIPAAWAEPGPTLEKRIAMRRAIQRALDMIPADLRLVLLLRDVEELSSREVAEQMGITDAAVRQRLHRARTAMAEILRPELCDGPELTCGG